MHRPWREKPGRVGWGWGVLNCYCLKGKACKRPSQHQSHRREQNKKRARREGRKKALKTDKPNPSFISSCAMRETKQTFKSLPAPSTSFAVSFSFFHALRLLTPVLCHLANANIRHCSCLQRHTAVVAVAAWNSTELASHLTFKWHTFIKCPITI